MKRFLVLLLLLAACSPENKERPSFTTVFETSNGTQTATYSEVIAFYEALDKEFPEIDIKTIGQTDSGYPLHLITYSPSGEFDFDKLRKDNLILMVNNGIHPGEPDGIDATMLLMRDLATGKQQIPEHLVFCAIAVYNIGGALNRNSTTRANQNGPEEYGFRGNARNFDLNRDFIKSDTRNAKAFAEVFQKVLPDVFIDNHVSNGADYQYTLTHLFTQHNKLGGDLGMYLHDELMPQLEASLSSKNWDITPYVNVFNRVPESGFSQFFDAPRYSTGYTTLWNTLGMMVETHMLKPYKPRVEGTYELMVSMMNIAAKDHDKIKNLRQAAFANFKTSTKYPVKWEVDTSKKSTLHFKGYEGQMIPSEVTGMSRLHYDRNAPFTKEVAYQDYFKSVKEVIVPKAYIIPQGWWKVIDLLKLNNIRMSPMAQDTTILAETYRIADFQTASTPFEGHYLHYNTNVSSSIEKVFCRKGDFWIPTDQPGFRYLLETLEPSATDSFFNWNFFDTILQQKEGFSPYVFEDIAKKLLEENKDLKEALEAKKAKDETFSQNWYMQLDWIYKQSVYYEKAHLKYPAYRVLR